jgi:hypothetical protein
VPVPQVLRRLQPAPRLVRVAPLVVLGGGVVWAVLINAFAGTPVRDAGDASSGELIYDADCGFCTRSAQWLARRRPERVRIVAWQAVPKKRSRPHSWPAAALLRRQAV